MSAPNITVKFLEPEELNDLLRRSDIKAKTSTHAAKPQEVQGNDSKPETEEVPEIVQESVNKPSPPAATPAEASPTAVSLRPKPQGEGSYKDNIAHEDNNPPALPAATPALPEGQPPQPRQQGGGTATAGKAPTQQVEKKKLLGSALDHSRRAQAERGGRGEPSASVPGHGWQGNSNKIGIGLMVAGIVGLLLTGRS